MAHGDEESAAQVEEQGEVEGGRQDEVEGGRAGELGGARAAASSRAPTPTACRSTRCEYLCCKLILRPNHFTSRESLFEFGEVLQGARQGARRQLLREGLPPAAAQDPRGPVRRHARLPALQQRLHPAAADPVPRRLSGRRSRDRLQVPPPGHADGRRDRRPAADPRRPPRQVQVPGAAAQGEARRDPPALLAQRAVSALRDGRRLERRHDRWTG